MQATEAQPSNYILLIYIWQYLQVYFTSTLQGIAECFGQLCTFVCRANEASSSEDQPAAKRRRGRRSRNEIEEALRNKEQQEAIAKAKQAQSGIGASAKEVRKKNILSITK